MVIFVPLGSERDATRKPEFYDGVFDYLRGVGVSVLS
jgi:hypothetical protein